MSWISGAVGAAGGILSSMGRSREQRKSNKFYADLYSPNRVNSYAAQLNPWLFSALGAQAPKGGWGNMFANPNQGMMGDLRKIIGGQDLSQYLLNQPLNQINRGAQQNLQQFQGMVGRSGMQGGLANAYGLANLGGRNNAIANMYNQYGQWREQQRRSDLDWIFSQIAGAQGQGTGLLNAYGSRWGQPTSSLTTIGNGALGFAAGSGMGMFGGGGSGTNPASVAGGAAQGAQGGTPAWSAFMNQGNANNWYNWGR